MMTPMTRKVLRLMLASFLLTNSAWATPKYRVLHNFKNVPDGGGPAAGVTFGQSGSLYGTTLGGGTGDKCGSNGPCLASNSCM